MSTVLGVFFDAILPVLAVVLIGYVAGRRGVLDPTAAGAINRFVFMIALPALVFRLIAFAPLETFPWAPAIAFLVVELVVMALGYVVARRGFGRPPVESMLLGMTAGFTNHVLLVLPIAKALFGEEAARPIVAIIVIDSVALFSVAVILLDLARDGGTGGTVRRAIGAIGRNPPVLAILAGLGVATVQAPLPEGAQFFLRFLGDAAAPAALCALGAVLAHRATSSDGAAPITLPVAIVALKLAVAPTLLWCAAAPAFALPTDEAVIALLTAAGPCGAMPFVLALQFGAPTATIARAILISTVASGVTLTIVANLV